MSERATVVLDVGKTLTKLSLWGADGRLIEHRDRPNERIETGLYVGLDAHGIETFVAESLEHFGKLADVEAIIPVGHGAAAAVVGEDGLAGPCVFGAHTSSGLAHGSSDRAASEGTPSGDRLATEAQRRESHEASATRRGTHGSSGLLLPPLDYEHPIPAAVRSAYNAQRDAFAVTGSPALPDGLNLGAQLFFLESLQPGLLSGDRRIVPWAQYWSWMLSGVAAAEVTSLGCHTDLWCPLTREPSPLARKRGWSDQLAPLHTAGSVLGTLRPDWAKRTRLSGEVRIHCGLHDSNAALLAARAAPEIAGQEATVLSTGTWFVAMRTPARGERVTMANLDEKRDCLVNVDVEGNPVPSARFMGGREIELLMGPDTQRLDTPTDQPALLACVSEVLANKAMALPTLAPGCGPFPRGRGRWVSMPTDAMQRRAAVALYVALVTDVALDLVGARARLLIEGRFSESQVFVRALAALRPETRVYVCQPRSDVSFGALKLIHPELQPSSALVRIEPLAEDLGDYRRRWRLEAESLDITTQ